jgi:hypothetical protein
VRSAAATFLVAGVLLAAACGGSGSVAVGWETHHVDDGGFSIGTPAAWRTAKEIDRDALDEFIADNPDFAPFKEAIAGGLIKFIASDPDISEDFATNLNVSVHALGRKVSLAKYRREWAALLRDFNAVRIRLDVVRLPAGRCVRASWEREYQTEDASRLVSTLQYAFVHSGSEYVVTFTTLPTLRNRYRTTFTRSARSFRFD